MKILYISNGSNFLGAGGMEYHLMDITRWLEGKGVETALAVRKGAFIHRVLLAGRPNVYPLPWTGIEKIASFINVLQAVRDFAPDIISINRERDIIPVLMILKCAGPFLKKRPKLVAVFHNSGWGRRPSVLSWLDGVIFPNHFLKDIYAPGPDSARINASVIYHGIHLPDLDAGKKLDPGRERRFFKGRKFPIIGMVGELRKNQAELIDVAAHLKKRVSEFTIAIIGRGNDEEIASLQEKIDRLGLTEQFVITGNVEKARMNDVFYDLDISVTTNRREPFGLVFLESLATYTPLVAYNSGGPVEILEKGGGVLVTGGPEDMARQLFALVTDHAVRTAMAQEGRVAAEKYFSIDAMGEGHYRFYEKLLTAK